MYTINIFYSFSELKNTCNAWYVMHTLKYPGQKLLDNLKLTTFRVTLV